MAELQLHGGAAVVGGVTRALLAQGLRLAEPGEFTRRAFEAGRLDLDQAEAVADLIDAETEAQARQALGQLEGALGQRYAAWRGLLSEALAYLEAAVDFPDEELPADVGARAVPALRRLASEMQTALADARRGERVRDGYRVALIGAPNAGKSRLLNALLDRDAAIVTATPGTTRDVIEAPLTLSGYRVLLADMAGVREAVDAIEAEGVRRARGWAQSADLRLWVVDASESEGAWREAVSLVQARDLLLLNKSDLAGGCDRAAALKAAEGAGQETIVISATTGAGVGDLRRLLTERVAADLGGAEFPAVTRERHAQLLGEGLEHIGRAEGRLEQPELAAEDLQLAAGRSSASPGASDRRTSLDVIFASFCIGK